MKNIPSWFCIENIEFILVFTYIYKCVDVCVVFSLVNKASKNKLNMTKMPNYCLKILV